MKPDGMKLIRETTPGGRTKPNGKTIPDGTILIVEMTPNGTTIPGGTILIEKMTPNGITIPDGTILIRETTPNGKTIPGGMKLIEKTRQTGGTTQNGTMKLIDLTDLMTGIGTIQTLQEIQSNTEWISIKTSIRMPASAISRTSNYSGMEIVQNRKKWRRPCMNLSSEKAEKQLDHGSACT